MDQIFKNRLSEQRNHLERTRKDNIAGPSIVALKDPRNSAEYADELSESNDPKRRRGPEGVVDREPRKAGLASRMQNPPRYAKSRSIFEPSPGVSSAVANSQPFGNKELEMRSRRRNTRDDLNPHLRGSKLKSDLGSRNLEHSPPPLKYSIHEGLGPVWRKPLVYPKTGKKKISVDWRDLERLDEGEYLNDTLIAFYLRFLEHQLEEGSPTLARKIYFFNTFFFASLTNSQKGKKCINYEAVEKWTRSTDIFSYDYIVVPINESQHWYVAIICNLPALARSPDMMEENPIEEESLLSPNDQVSSAPFPARNSSSRASVSSEKASALNEIVEPNDQDTAASFASLTLKTGYDKTPESGSDTHAEQGNGDTFNFVGADQSILDGAMKEKTPESTTLEPRKTLSGDVNFNQMHDDSISLLDHSPKISACLRKRKRKSIPPTQRIDPTSPLIIIFDSLGMTHPSTTRILKDYLLAEGNAKREMEIDTRRIKGLTAKQIPEQNNYCDCGLFLLGYIDKFLDNPGDFISKIIGRKYDVEKDWPKLNPSDLRASMRKQIQALHAEEEEEWREKAKKADKYHPKQSQNTKSTSKGTAQHEVNPQEMSASLEQPIDSAAPRLPKDSPSTRSKALETALPIGGRQAYHANDVILKKSKLSRDGHIFQDSSDPLHHDEREISAPRLPEEPSLIVIESQSDAAGSRPIIDSVGSIATPSSKRRSTLVEFPYEIQDSQPSSFQDLHAAAENICDTPSQQLSSRTEDQSSADLECVTPLRGTELENEPEGDRQHVNTKPTLERERQPERKPTPEIVEIDD